MCETMMKIMESDLQDLPVEIQGVIFSYIFAGSCPAELKLYRRMNHTMNHLATPFLFSSLHLSGSKLSFERLRSISENMHLAKHVTHLKFHRGSWYNPFGLGRHRQPQNQPMTYDEYKWEHPKALVHEFYTENSNPSLTELNIFRRNFLEEIESEKAFMQGFGWMSELREITDRFPKIVGLTIASAEKEPHSDYHCRKCGGIEQPFESPGRFRLPQLLRADGIRGLKHLFLDCAEPPEGLILSNPNDDLLAERFANLETLHVGFKVRSGEADLRLPSAWIRLLRRCSGGLKVLSIDLGQNFQMSQQANTNYFTSSLMTSLLELHFPRLHEVSLAGITAKEEDFVQFIARHDKSLRVLNVANWQVPALPRKTPVSWTRGSVIRAFWKIGLLSINLQSVSLNGVFSSHFYRLGWTADNTKSNSLTNSTSQQYSTSTQLCLRQRLEEYLCHREPFPFSDSFLEIWKQIVADDEDGAPSAEMIDEIPARLGFGDESFCWTKRLPDREMDAIWAIYVPGSNNTDRSSA